MTPRSWSTALDTLVTVELLEPDAIGLLWFGGERDGGGVLVERQRICWAAALGTQQRLRDLLRANVARGDVDLDQVYARCRRDGRLFGETLVEEGWVTPHELAESLRRHSAESLVELSRRASEGPTWTARSAGGYAARFTFEPIDVWFEIVAAQLPELHATAHATLASIATPGRWCAAFASDLMSDRPVPVATAGVSTVHELVQLGRHAAGIVLAQRELGMTATFTLATTDDGHALLVWSRGPLVYVIASEERGSLAAFATRTVEVEAR